MTSDVTRAQEAADEAYVKWCLCVEEAKKLAPPPPEHPASVEAYPPAGMWRGDPPPDPCADLKKRYDEAKKALEDAVDRERELHVPGVGGDLGWQQAREGIRETLKNYNSEELKNAKRNMAAQYEKQEREAKGATEVSRVRKSKKIWDEEMKREEERRR